MKVIQFIDEGNKEKMNKPANADQVYYSELNEWFTTNAFRSLSIKFVLQGSINYKVGRTEYEVCSNHFLLATKQTDVKAYFKTAEPVKSICIDICEDSLNDALTVLANENKNEVTDFHAEFLKHPHFIEDIYADKENLLGRRLLELSEQVKRIPDSAGPVYIGPEWFLETIELIIRSEFKNIEIQNKINALKTSTKREIIKRIHAGREFIDTDYLKNPDIKRIAMESNMSVFHFYRCFKQVLGISPYQYLLGKRLDHSNALLRGQALLIRDIAVKCGFPDVFTFSKAYKRKFGISPSKYLSSIQN